MTEIHDTDLINRLEFVDERERLFFAQAQLGEQVREFLASPVGRYLHGRAKQDVEEVKDQLLACNADSFFGRRKFSRLQQRAACATNFMRYLADAITEGEHAAREVDAYREKEGF